ncbi:calcium-binding protein [Catenovulum sediminis]|nr:calcium-binding protein [Catenovulum sediminis]
MFLNIKASIFILLMFFAPLTQAREVWLAEQWQNKANSTNIQTAKLSLSSCEDTVDYLWYQVTVSKSLSHSDIPPDIFVAIASHEWFVDHPNAKLYYEGKKNGIPVIQLDIGGHTNGLTSVQHPQCDIGDSCNTARQVPLDYVFTNEDIRYAGDKDVFKFTVEELKTIELYSTGEANVIGTLLNSSCQSIQVSQGFDQTNNFNIERILQPGNYYIQLQDQDNKHFGDYYDLHFVSGANAKVFNDTSGNQTIVGTDFGDVINQTSGNDQIYGGLGNDTISLINGSSVVHFDLGDGQDTLSVRRNNSSSYKPKLLFGNNITPDMVSLSKNGEDLYLTINNTTDQVIITDYFLYEAWYHRLEWIEFASDGTLWDWQNMSALLNPASNGDDTLTGFDSIADNFIALDGNDVINTKGANDFIDAGNGNDTIYPGGGNDTVYAGASDDIINQTNGNDQIYGGLGNDTISLINGSSVVHFDLGDGQDTLSVRRNNSSSYKPKLLFGNNITPDMVSLSKNGEDLYLTINNTTDQVIITDYFLYEAWYHRLEWIEFASDGTLWDWQNMSALLNPASNGDDTLTGFDSIADNFIALDGNDVINTKGANDFIDAGNGNDTIYPGGGNDTVYAGASDDIINQTNGNDQIYGGLGNDTISLINGSSVVHFDLGDGQDTLSVRRNNSSSYKPKLLFGNNITPDMVSLSKNGEDLYLTINNTTDQVIITDYFLYEAWYHRLEWIEFASDGTLWDWPRVASILNTGTNGDDILTGFNSLSETIYAGEGNDTISPKTGNDVIYAGAGDDIINQTNGNDQIYGGLGNDTISLINGSSVVHFDLGDGQDTLSVRRNNSSSYKPKLLFGNNITPDMVSLSKNGEDLYLTINNTTDQVIITDYFLYEAWYHRLEWIEFASDGTLWDWQNMSALLNPASNGDDTLTGFDSIADNFIALDGNDVINTKGANDFIDAGNGNDTIYPGGGNDTVYAGASDDIINQTNGNDQIYGGLGNDTISLINGSSVVHFDLGDGQDTLSVRRNNSSSYKPKLLFGNNITPDMVSLSKNGEDLYLTINNTTDQVIITDYFLYEAWYHRLEWIEFAIDSTQWTYETIKSML